MIKGHTNSIENPWSSLKLSITARHGVNLNNIENYIDKFNLRKKFIDFNKDEIDSSFYRLLLNYLNKVEF